MWKKTPPPPVSKNIHTDDRQKMATTPIYQQPIFTTNLHPKSSQGTGNHGGTVVTFMPSNHSLDSSEYRGSVFTSLGRFAIRGPGLGYVATYLWWSLESPLRNRVMGPLPNGRTSWLKYMGVAKVAKHLLAGMILQVENGSTPLDSTHHQDDCRTF